MNIYTVPPPSGIAAGASSTRKLRL